ncbi:uncharacterized protein LOC144478655 isoform X2 [Augochlora pura]
MVTVDHLINYSVEMNDSLRPFSSTFPYTDQDTYNLMSTKTYEKRSSSTKDVITGTQIIVLLLFACGILFALLMYCKTCNRSAQERYMEQRRLSDGNNQQTDSDSLYCCATNDSRERPPSYSDACNAPPLYGAPFNRGPYSANTRSGRTFKLADRMLTAHNFSKQQMASLCSSRNAFILSVNLFTSSAVMSLHVVALFRYFQEQLFVPQLIWSLMDKLTRIICSFTLLRINFFSTRINFANRNDSAWADTDSQKTIMFHNHGNLKHRITYDRY